MRLRRPYRRDWLHPRCSRPGRLRSDQGHRRKMLTAPTLAQRGPGRPSRRQPRRRPRPASQLRRLRQSRSPRRDHLLEARRRRSPRRPEKPERDRATAILDEDSHVVVWPKGRGGARHEPTDVDESAGMGRHVGRLDGHGPIQGRRPGWRRGGAGRRSDRAGRIGWLRRPLLRVAGGAPRSRSDLVRGRTAKRRSVALG